MSRIFDIKGQMDEEKYQMEEKKRLFEYYNVYPFTQQASTPPKVEKSKYKTLDFWIEETLKLSYKGLLGFIAGYLIYYFTK